MHALQRPVVSNGTVVAVQQNPYAAATGRLTTIRSTQEHIAGVRTIFNIR
jgi:hypothetical protein